MASSYFECHVTVEGDPVQIRPHVEAVKWKFSAIDGDINLGDGIKCYATRQFNRRLETREVEENLFAMAEILVKAGFKVLRRKVEMVIFDDRSSTVRCTGGCVECHLDDFCK